MVIGDEELEDAMIDMIGMGITQVETRNMVDDHDKRKARIDELTNTMVYNCLHAPELEAAVIISCIELINAAAASRAAGQDAPPEKAIAATVRALQAFSGCSEATGHFIACLIADGYDKMLGSGKLKLEVPS